MSYAFSFRQLSKKQSFVAGVATVAVFACVIFAFSWVMAWRCDAFYSHISPAARCIGESPSYTKAYEEFEDELSAWVDEEIVKGNIKDAAVYFRDMQNGPWFGIRESERFLPASLFKVPVMIAVLKVSEKQPSFLQEIIATPATLPDMWMDATDPEKTLQPNTTYSIDELLHKMIAYSDNLSMSILVRRLDAFDPGQDVAGKVYDDLGVLSAGESQTMSVKSYSTLFRILYNARYLNKHASEKALSLLAQSDFTQGLVAGLPPDVPVAHKFGVHNLEDNRLLHDCGIIYHPVRPYLLCVMTRNDSIDKSVDFIAELSRRVYEQVQQNIVQSW